MKGGARPGSGRKPATDPRAVIFKIRLTKEEHAQVMALGGSKWARARFIAEAKALDKHPVIGLKGD